MLLNVFHSVTDLLGFRHNLFFVPDDYHADDFETESERLSEIVLFTDLAADNITALGRGTDINYKIGLERTVSKNEIALFNELSSGEQQLLTLAIKLVVHAEARGVVLIDEPEISLHVSWQKALPKMFALISEQLNCSIVIATHSPVIIASAAHEHDYCFAAQQRTLVPISPAKRGSVETVLFDGFRTYTHHSRRLHERCAAIVADAIQRVNVVENHLAYDVSDIYSELDAIAEILNVTDTVTPDRQVKRDSDLLRQTRAAIDELFANQRVQTESR